MSTLPGSSETEHDAKLVLPLFNEDIGSMKVTRVFHDDGGSHIEPPCEDQWDDFTQLQWKAAVVSHDTGLDVKVSRAEYWIGKVKQNNSYSYHIAGGSGAGPHSFNDMWSTLNGISTGADAMRERLTEGEGS